MYYCKGKKEWIRQEEKDGIGLIEKIRKMVGKGYNKLVISILGNWRERIEIEWSI